MADTRATRARPAPVTVTLTSVSVIIPTFRRPEGLAAAMASVAAQDLSHLTGIDGLALSLIVCDNSPEASARDQVTAFGIVAAFPVSYIHEPATGVANARNSAVAACTADFIAFLDDDEEAPDTWLSKLFVAQDRFGADVVFGPVTARLAQTGSLYSGYFERFFSRFGAAQSEVLCCYYGCGNSLIRRALMPGDTPFSVEHNQMGGEDDRLFHGLQSSGAVMAWAADAPVFEDVPASRSTLNYTLRRAFAYGQGPSYTAAMNGKPFICALWMMQGVVQAVALTAWASVLWLARSARSAPAFDKAARGLGKLLWFPPFKIGFYGTALLQPKKLGRLGSA